VAPPALLNACCEPVSWSSADGTELFPETRWSGDRQADRDVELPLLADTLDRILAGGTPRSR